MQKNVQCPCASKRLYNQCCEPYHKKQSTPATAEALMRSRYSAYTLNLANYIYETWHPSTRPTLSSLKNNNALWIKLIVNNAVASKNNDEAFIDFNAFYQINDQLFNMHEISHFLKIKNLWLYVDGKVS